MTAAVVANYPTSLKAQLVSKLPWYGFGAGLLLVQQYLMARRDFFVRDAVNAATGTGNAAELTAAMHDAKTAAIAMIIVSIVASIARVMSRIAIFSAGRNVEYELRAVLLDRLQRLGPSFFRTMPTGEIMSRATSDLTQVRLLLGFGVLNVVSSAFGFISAVYVMATISLRLTLVSFTTMPVLWLVTRTFSTRMFKSTRENQEAIGQMSDRVLASLSGARVVRSFGLLKSETASFDESNEKYLEKSLSLARVRGSMGPVMGAIAASGILIVFWYGGSLLEKNVISTGDFVSFWLALLRLTWPLLALGFVSAIVQRGRAGYQRLRVIFDADPETKSGKLRRDEPVRGALSVRDLTFSHGTKKVLDGVSFEVPVGSSLAIVGRTGCGKSTIATLLPRLMPTPAGTVFLDGDDVCDLPLERVRGSIGYAQQDAFLFSTTVTRNIGYSLEEVESAEADKLIRDAAREAEVFNEVEGLPEGFDTVVGERGVQLSGGQRQRVALARALLRRAPVLILDDPLSAVDAKTESAILDAIDRQKKNRTVVLITHRIAAAKRCDNIIVLDRGKVVESGTHDQLINGEGLYAAFAREQEIEADLDALDLALPESVQ